MPPGVEDSGVEGVALTGYEKRRGQKLTSARKATVDELDSRHAFRLGHKAGRRRRRVGRDTGPRARVRSRVEGNVERISEGVGRDVGLWETESGRRRVGDGEGGQLQRRARLRAERTRTPHEREKATTPRIG